MSLDPEIASHYELDLERDRLNTVSGQLEFRRSVDIIGRYLPPPPAKILDVGGGTGRYAIHFAEMGYEVHLIDPMPNHLAHLEKSPNSKLLASFQLGDARELEIPDESFDAILLMGPLYHLIESEDRIVALNEAFRVLRPGGTLFAVGISRFASLFDGFFRGYICDSEFKAILDEDLWSGQHRNPSDHPAYFTTAKFHSAEELEDEILTAEFQSVRVLGIEGFGWLLPELELKSEEEIAEIVEYVGRIERAQDLVGMSAHLMAVATK